jgi:hypothetical protein
MSGMDENAGSISLSTLEQDTFWVGRHGVRHNLTDMPRGYLENTRSHLLWMASSLYSLELRNSLYSLELRKQDATQFIAELSGWDNGRDVRVLPRGQAAAEAWMESTPLVKAITALLDIKP